MGIFSSLGRKTERIKQKVTSDTEYRCISCEETFSEEFEACPSCGSETIVVKD